MEPRFQVTAKQDKESYRNRVLADFILHHKTPTPVFYGITVFLALFIWWGAVFASDNVVSPLVSVLYGGVLVAIAVLCAPYLDRFTVKRVSARMLRSTLKNAKDLGADMNLTFHDDGLVLETPTAHAERAYGALTELCETRSHMLLFQGKDFCFSFAKNSLTLGTAAELKPFLAEKCGKKVQFFDF